MPLVKWGKVYGDVQDMSGHSLDELLEEVKNNNPIVAWVTIKFQPARWGISDFGKAVNNNHAVTLDGYDLKMERFTYLIRFPVNIGSIKIPLKVYIMRNFAVVIR